VNFLLFDLGNATFDSGSFFCNSGNGTFSSGKPDCGSGYGYGYLKSGTPDLGSLVLFPGQGAAGEGATGRTGEGAKIEERRGKAKKLRNEEESFCLYRKAWFGGATKREPLRR